jgi:hypothetical protein
MAPRHSFSILLVAILLVGETIVAVVVISQNYTTILRNCSTSDNYTVASSCKINLVKLMANLEPDSVDDHGFRMSSAGEPPDAIFGLTMCYADKNWDQCQKCLRAGIASMPETCPSSQKMMVSYRACALRYTNESFFSVADVSRTTVESYAPIDPNATDMVGMNTTRLKLIVRLTRKAAASSPLLQANESVVSRDSDGIPQMVYRLAQCTRDLIVGECTRFLTYFMGKLLSSRPNHTSGAVMGYNCYYIRRDLNITFPPSHPPPSTSP